MSEPNQTTDPAYTSYTLSCQKPAVHQSVTHDNLCTVVGVQQVCMEVMSWQSNMPCTYFSFGHPAMLQRPPLV